MERATPAREREPELPEADAGEPEPSDQGTTGREPADAETADAETAGLPLFGENRE